MHRQISKARKVKRVPVLNGKTPVINVESKPVSNSSLYSPTVNKELSVPPWCQPDAPAVKNEDPLGVRIGGTDVKTDSSQIGLIMNSMQAAVSARNIKQMRGINGELKGLVRNMTMNVLMTRATWMFEQMLDPRGRDLFRECGYPLAISPQMYREMFDRSEIAGRVVELLPEECWEQAPDVYEDEDEEKTTKFEQQWKDLNDLHHFDHYLERIDKLSGIGSYGLLLIGIDDGKPLHEPVDGLDPVTGEMKKTVKEQKLLYLRAFDESMCHVGRWQTDQNSPRFAQPDMYLIRFLDYTTVPLGQSVSDVITHTVHWSRVVHIADNRKSSEVFGVPRMQRVFNRLLDLRKLYGGSAESMWKGGFPGIALEVLPELADAEIDQAAIREQIDAYQNSLRRYFAIAGMSAKTLETNVADPKSHVDVQLQAISISLGVPTRVFLGTEQAVKAGEQDSDAWDTRLQRRKNQYLSPLVIRPFVDRLIAMGVLAKPKKQYQVNWPEASSPTMKDKAAIAASFAQAIAAYMNAGGDQMFTPLDFMVNILGIDKITAEEIVENAAKYVAEQQAQQASQQAGGLPTAEDLVEALGMDPEDAQNVLDTITQMMQQQQQEQQGQAGGPDNSGGNSGGSAYQQPPATKEEATGGVIAGASGGIGSQGVTGTPGGVPWKV